MFVLRPDLMPHPASKQAHEIEQERNLAYVAVTRVKFSKESEGELVWVGGQSKLFGAKPEQNGYQSVDELPLSVDSVGAQFEQYKHGRIKQLRRDVQQ